MSAVRAVRLPLGQWQACLYWRSGAPATLYGPKFATAPECRVYVEAVKSWVYDPARGRGYLVWRDGRWERRGVEPSAGTPDRQPGDAGTGAGPKRDRPEVNIP